MRAAVTAVVLWGALCVQAGVAGDRPTGATALGTSGGWKRHTVDNTSRGADGARLADVNGDGHPDIATGWEEGGVVRAYLNPGPKAAGEPWPAVTVGKVASPEDAVFADVDGDGAVDVVSCCEGRTMAIFVHWAPKDPKAYLQAGAWRTEAFAAAKGAARWMFCAPAQIDGQRGRDLFVASKNPGGQVAWLECPANPRDLSAWKLHRIQVAGWVMSLIPTDMDGDGDQDVIVSDRKGSLRGCYWLENPGKAATKSGPWRRHDIGARGKEVMFVAWGDLDGDGRNDIAACTKPAELLLLRQEKPGGKVWSRHVIAKPAGTGSFKGPGIGDLDGDGQADLVFTCEHAGKLRGVMWLRRGKAGLDGPWQAKDVSHTAGTKFDLIEMYDFDGDGDLDVLTCEERENLGVIWYENPSR